VSRSSIEQLLEQTLARGETRIGELAIASTGDGFAVKHRDDLGRGDLRVYPLEEAIEIAKFDDAGKYRPLRTAPTLRHGWQILVRELAQVAEIIDAIYPGRLPALRAWKSGGLSTISLRGTLGRQTGMYRIAATISDAQIDEVVGDFCRSDGGCLRTILWKRDRNGSNPSTKLPPRKFDPQADQFAGIRGPRQASDGRKENCLPLLCQEACNLLVAECRKVVKE
jgi:sirohydrochlorin cobaltochelatase